MSGVIVEKFRIGKKSGKLVMRNTGFTRLVNIVFDCRGNKDLVERLCKELEKFTKSRDGAKALKLSTQEGVLI